MNTDNLYRVMEKDLPKLQSLLTECFEEDPLYQKLIPDDKIRAKLLPELFECDLIEYFNECEIYADCEEINGIIVVSDETEVYNKLQYYFDEFMAAMRTDHYLIKEDPTLKTLYHFIIGKDYLNSKWTEELEEQERLHLIYLAVRPSMQHHGISGQLLKELFHYADSKELLISLETHNDRNLPMYFHHGFELFEIIEKHFSLKQYCLVRKPTCKQTLEDRGLLQSH